VPLNEPDKARLDVVLLVTPASQNW